MSRLEELKELAGRATKLPWDTGPETGAGHVWVYAQGEPLLEPTHKVLQMFRVRKQGPERDWMRGETEDAAKDRFWKQKQADAAYIVAAANAVPDLVRCVERLRGALTGCGTYEDDSALRAADPEHWCSEGCEFGGMEYETGATIDRHSTWCENARAALAEVRSMLGEPK